METKLSNKLAVIIGRCIVVKSDESSNIVYIYDWNIINGVACVNLVS
jgi:hypothetical protein